MPPPIVLAASHKMFNGLQQSYRLPATATGFELFLPPQAVQGYRVPALYWLTDDEHQDFVRTGGAQRFAAQWGMALVTLAGKQAENLNTLHPLLQQTFPIAEECSIAGIGNGGDTALQLALSEHADYAAVSVFSPKGAAACMEYLPAARKLPILIDHGSEEQPDYPLWSPQNLTQTARSLGFQVLLKTRQGYSNNGFLHTSFIDTHIEFHADALGL
ncbi:hypothetical protein L4G92_01350 [Neisseria sp. ZJ106]|uniref:S-formylglutathione hydrolase n=1 Tax=Neisseria lisongii TaxID=2912188 RepID=A0ABY7RM77_9NEIS|nr:alpha/beta hydrolase-fold protein [Neisseria lisongii]MCF7520701.1 hypothetical protein [Neisseria lisongii]WCL72348.1 alpha/beta hydrolase-fold protein [Neisseria lisongii]